VNYILFIWLINTWQIKSNIIIKWKIFENIFRLNHNWRLLWLIWLMDTILYYWGLNAWENLWRHILIVATFFWSKKACLKCYKDTRCELSKWCNMYKTPTVHVNRIHSIYYAYMFITNRNIIFTQSKVFVFNLMCNLSICFFNLVEWTLSM
jgi:hypothetical protein